MQKKDDVLRIIKNTLQEFPVIEAYLFGSYSVSPEKAEDIDLGIVMKEKSLFFPLYSRLIEQIDYRIDLVPLQEENLFSMLVKRDGVKIYG